ncbi:hypothetical protein [Anaerocolumna chitinilytica]|uniref:Uncharacterized protein n=1 Tax=Anaerocolumna chitinilytica TaxID=1727145 RepID=A0A7I8DLC0_9FIRM|nr:hypothetical protein [Anaerocolumna chitinilytica]BCJ98091.1 hypothetical protein bsdcttw_11320 [Anaerocolumna chitinilytica]
MALISGLINSNVFNVFLGAIVTFMFTYFLNIKNQGMSYNQKVVDKRFEAYEDIVDTISELGHSITATDVNTLPSQCIFLNEKKNLRISLAIPYIFMTKSDLIEYSINLQKCCSKNVLWIDNKVSAELDFINDYLLNIWKIVEDRSDDDLKILGIVLHQELINFYISVNNIIQEDIYGGKIRKLKSIKYTIKVNNRRYRLLNTSLYKIGLSDLNKWFGDLYQCQECHYVECGKKCPLATYRFINKN